MRKTPRVLSVIATVIAAICLLGILVCVVLQKLLLPLMSAAPEAIERFIVPVGPVLYVLGVFLVLLMLTVATSTRKTGYWMEILCAVLLALLPSLQSGVTLLQNMLMGNYGASQLVAFSVVSSLCSIPVGAVYFAVVLALLACGMSIADKRSQK